MNLRGDYDTRDFSRNKDLLQIKSRECKIFIFLKNIFSSCHVFIYLSVPSGRANSLSPLLLTSSPEASVSSQNEREGG